MHVLLRAQTRVCTGTFTSTTEMGSFSLWHCLTWISPYHRRKPRYRMHKKI